MRTLTVVLAATLLFAGCMEERPEKVKRKGNDASPVAGSAPASGPAGSAAQPAFPVRVSQNGRYIVDAAGRPVFWLGTTQWQIFSGYTLEEAKLILQRSAANGFVFVQAM